MKNNYQIKALCTVSAPALTAAINQKLFFCQRDAVSTQERLILKKYFFESQTILLIDTLSVSLDLLSINALISKLTWLALLLKSIIIY